MNWKEQNLELLAKFAVYGWHMILELIILPSIYKIGIVPKFRHLTNQSKFKKKKYKLDFLFNAKIVKDMVQMLILDRKKYAYIVGFKKKHTKIFYRSSQNFLKNPKKPKGLIFLKPRI